jgi:hypothetical protein
MTFCFFIKVTDPEGEVKLSKTDLHGTRLDKKNMFNLRILFDAQIAFQVGGHSN